MASQVSPGIVLKERDLSNVVVTGSLAITAAVAGSFAKGPVGEIVNISSQKEFLNVFGSPAEGNAADWHVANEFLAYGGRLAVVRAESGVANAGSTQGVLVKSANDWAAGAGGSEAFVARSAGTHGNDLSIVVVDRGADQTVTFDSDFAALPAPGDAITIGGKAGKVYSRAANVVGVVLDDPSTLIAAGDVLAGAGPAGADMTVTSAVNWYLNAEIASTGIKLSAIGPRPGTSEFAAGRGHSWDEVHVAVIDKTTNTVVERLTYLSKLSDGVGAQGSKSYYKDVINEESAYIFNGAHVPVDVAYDRALGDASTEAAGKFGIVGLHIDDLTGGADDYAYTTSEISDAFDLFGDTEEATIDFILMGGSLATESDTKTKAQKVIAIAAARKDCIAFVSPHVGNQIGTTGALSAAAQRDNTVAFFSTLTSTSYAVFDSGIKYAYDRFSDKYRWIPCNGDIAGLCVNTSATVDDWISPAGVNRGSLRNAVKLAYNPNKADRDELYQNRINPIVAFPGQGITLFGDKTALASPSAFDRINVRRLFLNVEKRAKGLGQQVLFELNDEITRSGFASAMTSYLTEVQARRGVTDFLVVCDESNNTPDVIDRNEFVAELYIKPTRSVNFITITFTATKTGVSFSEVVGR